MANTTHLFTIEGTQFVLGLFWQPLSGSSNADRTKEIRSLANELSFDLYMVRNVSSTHCVGFTKTDQVRTGVMSAAAVISKTLEVEKRVRDFIFVSALPDGHWVYVAQREGVILPDGDQAFASEDAARACLLEHMSLGEWPTIIAPSIWGIGGSEEMSFQDMLPKKRNGKVKIHKWWRLLPMDKKRALSLHVGKIIIASVLAMAAMGGFYYYKAWKEKKAVQEAAALIAQQQIDSAGKVAQPPVHPWKTQPLASDMLGACIEAISQQRLFPGNWDIGSVTCSDGKLVVSWVPREGGWIEHLKSVVPNVVMSMDGTSASASSDIPALSTGQDEPLATENERLYTMYATSQRYGVKFTITPAAAPPPALPGQENKAPAPDWKEIGWKAEGITLPEVVLSALNGEGFRMRAMRATWQGGMFIWTMEGTQYVKP